MSSNMSDENFYKKASKGKINFTQGFGLMMAAISEITIYFVLAMYTGKWLNEHHAKDFNWMNVTVFSALGLSILTFTRIIRYLIRNG